MEYYTPLFVLLLSAALVSAQTHIITRSGPFEVAVPFGAENVHVTLCAGGGASGGPYSGHRGAGMGGGPQFDYGQVGACIHNLRVSLKGVEGRIHGTIGQGGGRAGTTDGYGQHSNVIFRQVLALEVVGGRGYVANWTTNCSDADDKSSPAAAGRNGFTCGSPGCLVLIFS